MLYVGRLAMSMMVALAACSGGDGSAAVTPAIDEFVIDDTTKSEIDDAVRDGDGAEGSYEYDESGGTLTITITSSSFACNIEEGTLVATVIELSATTLVVSFGGNDITTWARVDLGVSGPQSDVVGIWKTTDPELYLVLANDGSAQLFGQGDECQNDRPRNDQSCLLLEPSTATISIDGALSDWEALGTSSRLTDPAGDSTSSDLGADLRGLAASYDGTKLYVLMDLAGAPSEAFQGRQPPNDGSYRLTVQGYNGLSESITVAYSPEQSTWEAIGIGSDISTGVGDTGIEWGVDISPFVGEGFEEVDFIMVEVLGASGRLDEMNCGYLPIN